MADNNRGTPNAQMQSERDIIEGRAGTNLGTGNAGQAGASGMSGTSAFSGSTASGIGSSDNAGTGTASAASMQDVKQQARDMANQTKEQGKSMLEEKKGMAAGQVDSMAQAFRSTAKNLQGEGQQRTGDYVGMIADQLENAARQLKQKNLDELMHDAQDLARRSPATFLAGSVAVGFLLARFLKSSQQPADYHDDDQRDFRTRDRNGYRSARESRADGYGAHNMDSEDSTGMETGLGESYRTGSASGFSGSSSGGSSSYSGLSSSSRSDGAAYESTDLDPDRDGARFTSASASPLAGSAATGYPPAGVNDASLGASEAALRPSASGSSTSSNPSTLGGNNYGNR